MKWLALSFICAFISCIHASNQAVGVQGTLMCGSVPINNTAVKLWDINTLETDTGLGCVYTDSQGNFNVSGYADDTTSLDPQMWIYTNCNDNTLYGLVSKPCQREIKMTIPQSYINSGTKVTNWFNAGVMNMELKQQNEDRKCDLLNICTSLLQVITGK